MVAGAPSSRAAHATACPWLPALAATTPAARSSGVSVDSLLTAPRTLTEPVRWRLSAFSRTSRPTLLETYTGRQFVVASANPERRRRAAWTSASVGAVRSVAKVEHLLHYLPHRGQRIELASLHLVQEPPQLGIAGHRLLEMRLRTTRCDGENLAREVLTPPLLELTLLLEVLPVRLDLGPQLGDVLAARRLGHHDRRLPGTLAVERENRAHLVHHRLRRRMVHLVDRDHVGDLHDPGLQRLDGVARAGHQHEHDGVRDADHLDLALPRADGLEEDEVLSGGVEHEQRLHRRLGKAAEMAARSHRADENARIEEVVGQADAVAEERSVRERARRVDRDDADRALLLTQVAHERRDQARFAD